jgi:putative oxidoreductase
MLAGYAKAKGVPAPEAMVIVSGLMELAGGLLIAVGYQARLGAWLIVAFLVPVTFMIHNYWTAKDPQAKMTDMVMFNKNLALIGTALLIAYFGSGPFSLQP